MALIIFLFAWTIFALFVNIVVHYIGEDPHDWNAFERVCFAVAVTPWALVLALHSYFDPIDDHYTPEIVLGNLKEFYLGEGEA